MGKEIPLNENKNIFYIRGYLLDVDYLIINEVGTVRMTVRCDDKAYEVLDPDFIPYFYLIPSEGISKNLLMESSVNFFGSDIQPTDIEEEERSIFGKKVNVFKIYVRTPSHIPKLSTEFMKYGTPYEFDIPFAKRYLVDKGIIPFDIYKFKVLDKDGKLSILELSKEDNTESVKSNGMNVLCFDIETYNPVGMSRSNKDPVIMLSYSYLSHGKKGKGVVTFKEVDRDFVKVVKDEKELFSEFMHILNKFDIDIVSGYNSANFDVRYMLERAKILKIKFNLNRFEGETKIERHGFVDKVKIAGRIHVDMYTVAKFISIVGAAESILKLNSYTLKNVYEAVSKDKKVMVEKANIYEMWDGSKSDLGLLADYNLNDSHSLHIVYDSFVPIMIELSRISENSLSDICVSTTGQIVEFLLMRYAHMFNELIPNKPNIDMIHKRLSEPIIGAYVKTPNPGIYENLAIFDFRSLYPSIIISHNIDPSSLCKDCEDYYESPVGFRFSKTKRVITPKILEILIDARKEVKKKYKKDKGNIVLGSQSQALKITSNSFYGYLGYARSRWYSREAASSVTAYARQYIQKAISRSEEEGFKVIYGDTDSVVLLLGNKTRKDAIKFVDGFNHDLPESMNLELEDFYKRAIFVGKKLEQNSAGAKKKYAMISYDGYIKIRGFELVRRDWSRIARDTQKKVLEIILKEGEEGKAINVVKKAVERLRKGEVPLEDLTIRTQLRKSIDKYDIKSPEVMAAKKAISLKLKKKSEMEHSIISYIITKQGNTISEKACLTEFAKDYDADYYINHQVIPATMRILKEMNYTENELKGLGKQKKL